MIEERADGFLRMIRRAQRGRLKIYLGYCAGVGKTYQMLQEAHRLKDEGIDVVIGLVETHGRPETGKLTEGLESVQRRLLEYHGITIEEMDVDAILKRKPAVVLVDELAHTNVPGSKNTKRYQDVQDLLGTGIHVVTTLNVQHLESLYNTVEQLIKVRVRERLPDTVIADADQIVNVDLTTEDLLKRLQEGKVYSESKIDTALNNFFTIKNLEQLRELTLRELASQIDLRRRDPMEHEIPATPDQVMVCLSSRSPNSEALLRYGSRLAGRLNRNWYAIYVQTPSENPTSIDARTQRLLSSALTLAKQLGAMVFIYKGDDVGDTLLNFAKEYRVGHIVVGSSPRLPYWRRLLGKRTTVEQLMHKTKGITLVILDTRENDAKDFHNTPGVTGAPIITANQSAISQPVNINDYLNQEHIVIWKRPVLKNEVIKTLVETVCHDKEKSKIAAIKDAIIQREKEGSTFFNEGVAFPHALTKDIINFKIALGLTQEGIIDVESAKPIQIVFLILGPANAPNMQVKLLALTSKIAQNKFLVDIFQSASNPTEIFSAIVKFEFSQK